AALMVGLLRRARASSSATESGAGLAGDTPPVPRANGSSSLPGAGVGRGNAGGSPPPSWVPTIRPSRSSSGRGAWDVKAARTARPRDLAGRGGTVGVGVGSRPRGRAPAILVRPGGCDEGTAPGNSSARTELPPLASNAEQATSTG